MRARSSRPARFFNAHLRRRSPPDRCGAVAALADLVASGLTLQMAVERWPARVGGELGAELHGIARTVRLGAQVELAVGRSGAFGDEDRDVLCLILTMHRLHGGDLVSALRQQALRMRERDERVRSSRSAVAGVVTSGRMVAALPLVMLAVIPAAHAPLFDTAGVVTLASGIGLAIAGMRWMGALVPRPPLEPVGSLLVDQMAVLLEGGLALNRAAQACVSASSDPVGELGRVARRARLTGSWATALSTSSDAGLVRVGEQLLSSQELGVPAAGVLMSVARSLRAERDQAFEEALRKAPVHMVVPLVVCVLPSFCLIGLVPFMRTFSL